MVGIKQELRLNADCCVAFDFKMAAASHAVRKFR